MITDGFDTWWEECDDPRCDIQVVRPGKVQCSNYCLASTQADMKIDPESQVRKND